jgi:hypothetical protein
MAPVITRQDPHQTCRLIFPRALPEAVPMMRRLFTRERSKVRSPVRPPSGLSVQRLSNRIPGAVPQQSWGTIGAPCSARLTKIAPPLPAPHCFNLAIRCSPAPNNSANDPRRQWYGKLPNQLDGHLQQKSRSTHRRFESRAVVTAPSPWAKNTSRALRATSGAAEGREKPSNSPARPSLSRSFLAFVRTCRHKRRELLHRKALIKQNVADEVMPGDNPASERMTPADGGIRAEPPVGRVLVGDEIGMLRINRR